MRLTVQERVFILECYLKRCLTPTVDKVSLKNLEFGDEFYSCHRRSKWKNAKKSCEEHGETCR